MVFCTIKQSINVIEHDKSHKIETLRQSRSEANYLSNYYDDSWKCGRRLYLHEYKEIQHNELEIVTKEAETLGLVTGFINTLGNYYEGNKMASYLIL